MKKKSIGKKLLLKKITITNLNQMRKIKGGLPAERTGGSCDCEPATTWIIC